MKPVQQTPPAYFDAVRPLGRVRRFRGLPVPRLHAEWHCDPEGRGFALFRWGLVHTHHEKPNVQLLRVFGETRRTGGLVEPDALWNAALRHQDYGLPWRAAFDIRHDCEQLRLPAFLFVGDEYVRLDQYVLPSPTGFMQKRNVGAP